MPSSATIAVSPLPRSCHIQQYTQSVSCSIYPLVNKLDHSLLKLAYNHHHKSFVEAYPSHARPYLLALCPTFRPDRFFITIYITVTTTFSMESVLPSRLLGRNNEDFFVFDPMNSPHTVQSFDIISYTWGDTVPAYNCEIRGVDWDVIIQPKKLRDIKKFMIVAGVQYLWVDCVCINQTESPEKSTEIAKMYQYYKSAHTCHILLDMDQVWDPQNIVDNLKFIDHILSHMGGAALASEANLGPNLTKRLVEWANADWKFALDQSIVRSAAIDMGVLNCYSASVGYVRSLFDNPYFKRVWTFQEMLLGKNITMWGNNEEKLSRIGELNTWMDLATDSKDKAWKLLFWIENCRVLKTASVNTILQIIQEDNAALNSLQTQVKGMSCARTDIINGGPNWWYENHKGISNIFSAVSLTPRKCYKMHDIFRGLLGVFSGLFTPQEIEEVITGDNVENISFAFFKRLSIRTGCAWTKLAISSGERGTSDWIPMIAKSDRVMTTDCFSGVINMGRLNKKGLAKASAMTSIIGAPRKYMKITLKREDRGVQFVFRGCNCGKSVSTGLFGSEPIPLNDQPRDVFNDETGRILVQYATVLGTILDPASHVVDYRRRLLGKLQPNWKISDPSAKPSGWIDRCVSGTYWENPHPLFLRTHNMSMNYRMQSITGCESRLENESTSSISCEVSVNCGCLIIAPFSLVFEALMAVQGSFLGDAYATLDSDNRIILKDGLGLVQVGDVGRTFSLVAFGGDIDAHRTYSSKCRSTKKNKPVPWPERLQWPRGRALVRDEFTHGITDTMRDYAYVGTGGSGNLLICRNHVIDDYRIIGICIDEYIANKKGNQSVTIR